MDICEMHALMTVAVMKERGGEVMRRLDSMYGSDDVPRITHKDSVPNPPLIVRGRVSVVYYLRFDSRVKIGTSTNLTNRLSGLPYDELLAIEPGSFPEERKRHIQFDHTRMTGEWFQYTADMNDHTNHLRRLYGTPSKTVRLWEEQHAVQNT
jgi:hypothetical protein